MHVCMVCTAASILCCAQLFHPSTPWHSLCGCFGSQLPVINLHNRLEHLERVSAAEAAAVLVLHPDPPISSSSSATDTDAGAEGNCAGGSLQGAAGAAGGGVGSGSGCGSGGRAGGDSDAGAASLTLQTIMALTSQLAGRKASVVVQVRQRGGCWLEEHVLSRVVLGMFDGHGRSQEAQETHYRSGYGLCWLVCSCTVPSAAFCDVLRRAVLCCGVLCRFQRPTMWPQAAGDPRSWR